MDKIRCFVSLELPKEIVQQAIDVQNQLRKTDWIHGRYTLPENIHLTLKFLSEQTPHTVQEIIQRINNLRFSPIKISTGHSGVFSRRDVRIVWIHLKGADEIQQLVDNALEGLFVKEERFMSHITLARVKKVNDKSKLLTWLDNLEFPSKTHQVSKIHLMKSTLTPDGPVYEVLETFMADNSYEPGNP